MVSDIHKKRIAKYLTQEQKQMLETVTGMFSLIKQSGGKFRDEAAYKDALFKYAISTVEFEKNARKRLPESESAYRDLVARLALREELKRVLKFQYDFRQRHKGEPVSVPEYEIPYFKKGRELEDIIRLEHGLTTIKEIQKKKVRGILFDGDGKEKDIVSILGELSKKYNASYPRELLEKMLDYSCRIADYEGDFFHKHKSKHAETIKRVMKKLMVELDGELKNSLHHAPPGSKFKIEYKLGRDKKTEKPTFVLYAIKDVSS